MIWLTAGLFALACNLDTLLLALVFVAGGWHCTVGTAAVMGIMTTAVTGVALVLGQVAGGLPGGEKLGGLVLLALGLWCLLDYLRHPTGQTAAPLATPSGFRQTVALAAALAVNNCGAGLAAGAAGLALVPCLIATLGATLLFLAMGQWAGRQVSTQVVTHLALPLSGGLLVLLGLLELWLC